MIKFIEKIINHTKRKNNQLFDETWVIRFLKPRVFIDVGSNTAQFPFKARRRGFNGLVITLEPIKYLFDTIVEKSKNQNNWININSGVSNKKGKSEIYVMGGHGGTSSLLKPTKHLAGNAGASGKFKRKEKITITTLDDVISQHCPKEKDIYIKVDVQGLELQVMQGLKKHSSKVIGCRLEMAINTADYENQPNMQYIIDYMRAKGFDLVHLEETWRNHKTKELLYMDGVFLRAKGKK